MQLTKYAEFLDCSPSYVVTEALKLVCNKDKEFQSWLSDQHTKTSEPTAKGESFQLELKQDPCTAVSNSVCVRTQRLTDDMTHAL